MHSLWGKGIIIIIISKGSAQVEDQRSKGAELRGGTPQDPRTSRFYGALGAQQLELFDEPQPGSGKEIKDQRGNYSSK